MAAVAVARTQNGVFAPVAALGGNGQRNRSLFNFVTRAWGEEEEEEEVA